MKSTQFDDNLKRLRRELLKLEGTETPIARRNARRRVLAAARLLRAVVDREYPAIVSREGVTRATPELCIKRLRKAGWQGVTGAQAGAFALVGIKCKRVAWKTVNTGQGAQVYVKGKGWQSPVYKDVIKFEHHFAPAWAYAIATENGAHGAMPSAHAAALRAAKKSHSLKRGALTAQALTEAVAE